MPPKDKAKRRNEKARRAEGEMLLVGAVFAGDIEKIKALIDAGININPTESKDAMQLPPIIVAIIANRADCVELLLARGADANAKNLPLDGTPAYSALTHAVAQNQLSVVAMLIEHGAKMDACQDSEGNALTMGCQNPHASECVRLLLKAGADAHTLLNGETCLHIATREGNAAGVAALLEYGAKVDALDEDGFSPLAVGCEVGSAECVSLLLQGGADRNALNSGKTAMQIARHNSHAPCIALLASSPPPESATYAAGQRVQIVGLVGTPELNGTYGEVQGFVKEKGRYRVNLISKGQQVALKAENLAVGAEAVAATLNSLKAAVNKCACCGAVGGAKGSVLKACGQCKSEGVSSPVLYCGMECARNDWKASHKSWHKNRTEQVSNVDKTFAKMIPAEVNGTHLGEWNSPRGWRDKWRIPQPC